MAELVLYTNPMSRGRIARWMLEEVGAPYKTEILEFGPSMKSADYLAINPMGKVPALVHGNHVITECAAIIAYVADIFPDTGLAPPPAERADYYRWMFFAAGPLEAAVTHRAMDVTPTPKQQGMVGYGTMETLLGVLEAHLTDQPYATGREFTAADVYLGSQIGWGLQFGTIDARKAFTDYFDRLKGRDAWRRAQSIDDALMPRDAV